MVKRACPAAASVALILALATPASPAVTPRREILVRVYDASNLPHNVRTRALGEASRALATASLLVQWLTCSGLQVDRACHPPLDPGERVVRIVRMPVPEISRGVLPLGEALVEPKTGSGTLATIYYDRVKSLADDAGVDLATVLGRAIAHELGHLLLASAGHAPRGLMRSNWSPRDLRRQAAGGWAFTRADRATIQRRLQTPGMRMMSGHRLTSRGVSTEQSASVETK